MATGPNARLALFRPFERFFRLESAGGIVLFAAAVAALVWANSPFGDAYFAVWETTGVLGIGAFTLSKPILLWVNDGLMAVFFLLVGLEIKRELMTGELSNRRAATLPVVAAVGGMIVPAAIFAALTWGTPAIAGWGVPMATDIAFALGVLALLGRRLPPSLRIFLAAAAIVDDIGAVLVIALFYTPTIAVQALLVATIAFGALVVMNRRGVHSLTLYLILGAVLWVAVLKSGVHATIAGVLLALTIPATAPRGPRTQLNAFEEAVTNALPDTEERQAALLALEKTAEREEALLTRMEHGLVPWVSFGVMPIFALANAGVRIEASLVDVLTAPVSLGIVLGLVVGKQIGVLLFPYLAVRLGFASLPANAGWRHLYGVSWLAGIGFTMSLFIAGLGLPVDLQDEAKLAILSASLVAGVGGTLVLLATSRRARVAP